MGLLERKTRTLRTYFLFGLGSLTLAFMISGIGVRIWVEDRLQEQMDAQVRALSRNRAQLDLLLVLLEEEVGLRTYLGTGDYAFLENYEAGSRAEGEALATILDNLPEQNSKAAEARLAHLEFLIREWHEKAAKPLIMARVKGPLPNLKGSLEAESRPFEALKEASNALSRGLEAQDEQVLIQLEHSLGVARWIGAATYAGLILAGFLLSRWLHRRVARPLSELAEQARAGDGFFEPDEPPSVREVAILGKALHQLDVQSREREQTLRTEHEEALAIRAFAEVVQHVSDEQELLEALDQALARQCKTVSQRILLRAATGNGLVSAYPAMAPEDAAAFPVMVDAQKCRALRQGETVDLPAAAVTACICKLGVPLRGAYLCIPMVASGQVLGLVNLQASHPGHWHTSRRRMAEAFISVASPALQAIRSLERAREQSLRDGLTGIHNRRFLDEFLPKVGDQAARMNFPLSVLMLDIDHFKAFNDEFGHEGGDLVLKVFAQALQAQVRGGDILARYGGEEFAILLPNTGADLAESLAERLRRHIQNLPLPDPPIPHGRHLTTSIGVASYPDQTLDPAALIGLADEALYEAKGNGRNRVASAGRLGRFLMD